MDTLLVGSSRDFTRIRNAANTVIEHSAYLASLHVQSLEERGRRDVTDSRDINSHVTFITLHLVALQTSTECCNSTIRAV